MMLFGPVGGERMGHWGRIMGFWLLAAMPRNALCPKCHKGHPWYSGTLMDRFILVQNA